MKTIYNKLFFLAALFIFCQSLPAQAPRVVKIDGIVPPDGSLIYDQIFNAIAADAPNRATNPNVVYELRRGQVYLASSTINANDFNLIIRAEAGTGTKPLILHTKSSLGANNAFINAFKNLTLENIEFDGQHSDLSFAARAINLQGKGYRAIIRGCWITGDFGGAITIRSDNVKLYLIDCICGNLGHYISLGGNGRVIENRAKTVDTITIQNGTFYNVTDRFLRNMSSCVINYVKIDHNTIANCESYNGCVQLGKTKKAIITNNIFANPMILGDRLPMNYRGEQFSPDKAFAIIEHDSLGIGLTSYTVEMRNNNIYHEKKFVDLFNETPPNDSILNPKPVNSVIAAALGSNLSKAYFGEELAFANTSSSEDLFKFVVYWLGYPNASLMPMNFSTIYPYEWDVSYPTSAISYTAADNGYPVGDLNAFPALKTKWLNGEVLSKSEAISTDNGLGIDNYPNPFSTQTTIHYTVANTQKVEVCIYNSYGQKAKVLINANLTEGEYDVSWDGTDNSGAELPNGLYLVQISGSNGKTTKKIMKH